MKVDDLFSFFFGLQLNLGWCFVKLKPPSKILDPPLCPPEFLMLFVCAI